MRFLVVARPRDPIPPQQIPMLTEAAKQWFDHNQDRLVSFGNFAGGGGYGVFDADSEEQLWRGIWEMPFIPLSDVTVDVVWDGKAGFDLFSDVAQKMLSQMGSAMGQQPAM